MSKGTARRPKKVTEKELDDNWKNAFRKKGCKCKSLGYICKKCMDKDKRFIRKTD